LGFFWLPGQHPRRLIALKTRVFVQRGVGRRLVIAVVPGLNIRQVNIYDPDGNHIEIQFGPDEQADMASFEGRAS